MNIDKDIDTDVSYRTSSKAISFVCRTLGLEKSDFINISVETIVWIASELARGRKIFSSDDGGKTVEYEYPTGRTAVGMLVNRRVDNVTNLIKKEDTVDKWLRDNLESN